MKDKNFTAKVGVANYIVYCLNQEVFCILKSMPSGGNSCSFNAQVLLGYLLQTQEVC